MNIYRIAGFICLYLISFTISCKTARYVIWVTGSDTTTKNLVLQLKDGTPADSINVHEDDKVLWKIKTNTVHAIANIDDKSITGQPTFITERKPHKKLLSKTWVEKVNRVVKDEFKSTGYVKEFYFITWKTKARDTLTYDPLMQIYPRRP